MPLVSAKCPNCDGEIQLDDSKERGFCLHCGSQVEVKEAVQRVKLEGQIAVDGIAGLDRLITTTLTKMKLEDWNAVNKNLDELREKYPDSVQTWLLHAAECFENTNCKPINGMPHYAKYFMQSAGKIATDENIKKICEELYCQYAKRMDIRKQQSPISDELRRLYNTTPDENFFNTVIERSEECMARFHEFNIEINKLRRSFLFVRRKWKYFSFRTDVMTSGGPSTLLDDRGYYSITREFHQTLPSCLAPQNPYTCNIREKIDLLETALSKKFYCALKAKFSNFDTRIDGIIPSCKEARKYFIEYNKIATEIFQELPVVINNLKNQLNNFDKALSDHSEKIAQEKHKLSEIETYAENVRCKISTLFQSVGLNLPDNIIKKL